MPRGKISPPPDNLDRRTRPLNWQDRTGHRLGKLIVTGWAGYGPWGKGQRNWWTCQCDCGTITTLVLTPHRISCGCRQKETRGLGPMYQRVGLMDKIESVTGKRLTIQQCCRLYKIRYATLRSRLYRFPDEPKRWGLTHKKKPPNLEKRKREYAEPGINRTARAADRRRREADDRQRDSS